VVSTLGPFDIQLAVAEMSSYRVAPHIGHLNRLNRVYRYLKRNQKGEIRFGTQIPDHESVATPVGYDWSSTIYGDVNEELPLDMPIPKDKAMRLTTYQDANLYHDLVTWCSMSWFSKKQKTVDNATYGSDFLVALQTNYGITLYALYDGHSP
jgi:hypothetical protein